ncbi:hypothetical protein R5R35_004875 [Gryllus longicercus]|uniref:G-protein coupled receptors family 1 profile domain-containing protein n=1 Tax=Gryllus longicercus TaxID=2509291 RepID=A0AAN9V870_9ORTH
MLVAVVVLFVVCWAPLLVLNVLRAYGVVPANAPGAPKHAATAFHLMAYFNSCINPLVYGFMSRNFRESFRKALCRCWRRRGRLGSRHPSLSQTRTTSVRCHTVSMTMAGLSAHNGQQQQQQHSAGGGGGGGGAGAPWASAASANAHHLHHQPPTAESALLA